MNNKPSVEKKILLAKIGQMSSLPIPSASMMNIMAVLRDIDNVQVSNLVFELERDQSLCSQVLKLINSGFYGLRKTVDTVDRAVALLGAIKIKQLVYSVSIMEFFSEDDIIDWKHSYATSNLMHTFIEENELPGIGNLPLIMIMHDLGKIVLKRFAPKKFQMAKNQSAGTQVPLFRVEEQLIGLNHAETGAFLLEKWDSAPEIVNAVRYHHAEEVPQESVFEVALIRFIDWIDNQARGIPCEPPGKELLADAGIEEIDAGYWIQRHAKLLEELENIKSAPARPDLVKEPLEEEPSKPEKEEPLPPQREKTVLIDVVPEEKEAPPPAEPPAPKKKKGIFATLIGFLHKLLNIQDIREDDESV